MEVEGEKKLFSSLMLYLDMWYDSLKDNEPLELSQVCLALSYQPHFQYCAWNDSTEHVNYSLAHVPYMANYLEDEQTSFTAQQQQLDSNTNLSCSPEVSQNKNLQPHPT